MCCSKRATTLGHFPVLRSGKVKPSQVTHTADDKKFSTEDLPTPLGVRTRWKLGASQGRLPRSLSQARKATTGWLLGPRSPPDIPTRSPALCGAPLPSLKGPLQCQVPAVRTRREPHAGMLSFLLLTVLSVNPWDIRTLMCKTAWVRSTVWSLPHKMLLPSICSSPQDTAMR